MSDSSTIPDHRRALLNRIEAILDEHIRPGLRLDGGDLELVSIDDDNIVPLKAVGKMQADSLPNGVDLMRCPTPGCTYEDTVTP